MHHEGRKQAQRRARALAGDDKDAPGLATPPGGDGQDRQPARALIQRGNQPRQPVGSLDQRDPPARPQSTQASVDPCPQRRILVARFGPTGFRGGCATQEIGGIRDDVIEAFGTQSRRHPHQIAHHDPHRDAVPRGVLPRQFGVNPLPFQPGQRQVRHPPAQAQAGDSRPAAQLQHRLPRLGRAGRRQHHRIGARSIAPDRLCKPQTPVQNAMVAIRRQNKTMMGVRGDIYVLGDQKGRYSISGLATDVLIVCGIASVVPSFVADQWLSLLILFIVGLMFFVRRPLQLLQVVTAFTVAHSITLALGTFLIYAAR